MSVIDSLRALFRRGGGSNIQVIYSVRAANVLGMSPTELYRKQPALRAVVSYIADNVADVPIKCYERRGDADRPRDTTSSLALLLARPSRGKTPYELKRAIVSDILIYDHALLVVLPDASSPSGWSMRAIPWSWVDHNVTSDGFEPSRFVVTNPYTGGRAEFDAEDCIHFHGYDPAGGMGVTSPIDALREVLCEQINAWGFRNSVWRNGGRVTQYLTRPVNAAHWEPNERARFAKSWKEKFAGEGGTNTGGTPLLEDGMELKSVPFNAREAEWSEATRLSRSDVAAVYHVNPSLIWHDSTQTYASAKDNARALYSEALSPIMTMVQEKLNARLVEMLGMDPTLSYCEFDISSKLAASFEEQASVLQSSVGGPWMLRNEARARMNLPALPGGDELIVPLNVTVGGLASPNDTNPNKGAYELPLTNQMPVFQVSEETIKALVESMERVLAAQTKSLSPAKEDAPKELRYQSKASQSATLEIADVLRAFYKRQAKSFANALAAMDDPALDDLWGQKDRWVRELAEDLAGAGDRTVMEAARDALVVLGLDPDDFDLRALILTSTDMCETRANHIVQSTMERLEKEIETARSAGTLTRENVSALVDDLYERLMESRVERNAESLATGLANAGTVQGAKKGDPTCQKVWIATGKNTRSSHMAMNGERVGIDERFSNGAMWPGDTALGAAETCNCHCRIEIVSTR